MDDFTRSNIDHLRGRRSIKQVGEESGAGQSWLQRFMNPDRDGGIQKANVEKLGKLARYFNVSDDALRKQNLAAGHGSAAGQSQAARFDDATMQQAVELLFLMGDARPDDKRFRRPTWAMIQIAAKAIQRAEGEPREAMATILEELEAE